MNEPNGRFLARWSRLKQRDREAHDAQRSAGEPVAHAAAAVATAPGAATPKAATREAATREAATLEAARRATGASRASASAPNESPPAPKESQSVSAASAGDARPSGGPSAIPSEVPLPALESLTPQSDFRPFMQAGIDSATRNAALKRLFADPQFSIQDGLDVYIDDYGKTEPIPSALLAGLKQLHSIGALDDGVVEAAGDASAAAAQPIAASGTETPERTSNRADRCCAQAPIRGDETA